MFVPVSWYIFSETVEDTVLSPNSIEELNDLFPPWKPGYEPYRATSDDWNRPCEDFDWEAACPGIYRWQNLYWELSVILKY